MSRPLLRAGEGVPKAPRGVERLLRLSVCHPWLVVGTIVVMTVAVSLAIPRIRLRLDGRALIPQGHPAEIESHRAAELFRLRDVVVLGVASPRETIYNPRTLALVVQLGETLAGIEGIVPESVASLATLPRFFVEDDTLDPQPLLARDRPPDAALAERLRRETRALGLDDGILVSADGRVTAIFAEVYPDADRYQVLQQVRRLVHSLGDDGDRIYVSGTALAQAVLGLSAAQDLSRLLPAVILIVALVLTVSFRHPAPALVSLAEIGASLLWTAGLMGLRGESVFVTTLVLPVILVVIGVSDDVYALNRYFREARLAPGASTAEAVVAGFSAVARPILLTAATTIAGLASLAAADLEPQRVFGVYGALAILFSTLFSFTLVPALLVLIDPKVAPAGAAGAILETRGPSLLFGLLRRVGPRRFLVLGLLLALGSAWAVRRLRIEDDWVRNLPPGSDIAVGSRVLDGALAGTIRLEVLVDSRKRDGFLDPRAFERLGRQEAALAALPGVGAVQSVYGDVARVQAALEGVDYAAWRRRDVPLGSAEIEQSLLLLGSLRRSPLSERLDAAYQRARITVFIRAANYSRIARVVRAASGMSTDAVILTPFGDGWISYLAVRLLVVGQVKSVGFALLANVFLLLLLFRRVDATLLALLPVLISVLLVFAVLALSGVPLGIANSMFAAVALGIGVDYSIHLVAQYRERRAAGRAAVAAIEEAVALTGPAIVKSAGAIALGLGSLAFSEVLPNRQLGLLVSLSLTVCAVMTLLVVPGVVLAAAAWRRRSGSDPG